MPSHNYHQDGAPPHYLNIVCIFLNEKFPDSWIGRGRPTPWPPRSPDLTPLDFFFWEGERWEFVQDRVYQTPVADLHHQIVEVIALVIPEILSHVWQEIEYCLDITRATKGAHIEIH